METGLATGWCERRADRDRTLLLTLRGEAGLGDASSLLEEDTCQRARRDPAHRGPGAAPHLSAARGPGGLSTTPTAAPVTQQ